MTGDEMRNHRKDAQRDLVEARDAMKRALRRLKACGNHTLTTVEELSKVQGALVGVMEFNASCWEEG